MASAVLNWRAGGQPQGGGSHPPAGNASGYSHASYEHNQYAARCNPYQGGGIELEVLEDTDDSDSDSDDPEEWWYRERARRTFKPRRPPKPPQPKKIDFSRRRQLEDVTMAAGQDSFDVRESDAHSSPTDDELQSRPEQTEQPKQLKRQQPDKVDQLERSFKAAPARKAKPWALQIAKESGKTMLTMKRPEQEDGKRRWKTGIVARVIPDKSIGFIQPQQQSEDDNSSLDMRSDNDVFFHFTRVKLDAIAGMSLSPSDVVEFKLEETRKKQVQAQNARASEVTVTAINCTSEQFISWLDELCSLVKADDRVTAVRYLNAHLIWKTMLNQSISDRNWANILAGRIIKTLLDLKDFLSAMPNVFKNLTAAISKCTFFNPLTGALLGYMQQSYPDWQLLEDFLLALCTADNSLLQLVVPLVRKMVDMPSYPQDRVKKCLLKFLQCMVVTTTDNDPETCSWSNLPLAPTSTELTGQLITTATGEWSATAYTGPALPVVRRHGNYKSVDDYLDTYFRLLREDCFAALKTGVQNLLQGKLDIRDMNVYYQVKLDAMESLVKDKNKRRQRGIGQSSSGFSLGIRVKPVRPVKDWQKTSALMYGNLVCITTDGSFSNPLWATVRSNANMATEGILLVDPCTDINGSDMAEFISRMRSASPHTTLMLESPAYYKAYQPVLLCLRDMTSEDIPFTEEIVDCLKDTEYPPEYLDTHAISEEAGDAQSDTKKKREISFDPTCLYKPLPNEDADKEESASSSTAIRNDAEPLAVQKSSELGGVVAAPSLQESCAVASINHTSSKADMLSAQHKPDTRTRLLDTARQLESSSDGMYHRQWGIFSSAVSALRGPPSMTLPDVLNLLEDDDADLCVDLSQRKAIAHTLRHRLALIQGPPGTGKTYIGIKLVQLLLTASSLKQKVFLVLTYKNHALDEFLLACMKFMRVVRAGGRSDNEALESRNINRIRVVAGHSEHERIGKRKAANDLQGIVQELSDATHFSVHGFLTYASPTQIMKLLFGVKKDRLSNADYMKLSGIFPKGDLDEWLLGVDQSALLHLVQLALAMWLPGQQIFDQLRQTMESSQANATGTAQFTPVQTQKSAGEAESSEDDEERKETLQHRKGGRAKEDPVRLVYWDVIHDAWPREIPGMEGQAHQVATELTSALEDDVWRLDGIRRAIFVQHIISLRKQDCRRRLEQAVYQFTHCSEQLRLHTALEKAQHLKETGAIMLGMTITGASMNHELLAALKPSVVIVEEAAEVLEPQIVAALGPWVQHLIMIGDHKQLRPSVESYTLVKDHHFDISMIERLLNNKMPHGLLLTQNRMRPEFSKLLLDIYPDYKDNLSVVSQNKVPACMADSMFFWHHTHKEDKSRSVENREEAEMVVRLALWFVQQGYDPADVTILTPYLGQTRRVRRLMQDSLSSVFDIQDHPDFIAEVMEEESLLQDARGEKKPLQPTAEQINKARDRHSVQVHTIDRYQGDENQIVIVSLTRSNPEGKIGFLDQLNRRCVAQSRAKCGMYFVGNFMTVQASANWKFLLSGLQEKSLVSPILQLACQKHPSASVKVKSAKDIPINRNDFCDEPCGILMPCDVHNCQRRCQPWHPHKICRQQVDFEFSVCGHASTKECYQPESALKCTSPKQFICPGSNCTKVYVRQCHDVAAEDEISYRCKETVTVTLPCQHKATKVCSARDPPCEFPCSKTLEKCGHICSALCGANCKSVPCKECERIERQRQEDKRKELESEVARLQTLQEEENFKMSSPDQAVGQLMKTDDSGIREIRQASINLLDKTMKKERQPQITNVQEIRNRNIEISQHEERMKLKTVTGDSQRLPISVQDPNVLAVLVQDGCAKMKQTIGSQSVWTVPSAECFSLEDVSGRTSNYIVWCDVYLGKTQEFQTLPSTLPSEEEREFDSCFIKSANGAGGYYCLFECNLIRPRYAVEFKCKALASVLNTALESKSMHSGEFERMTVEPSRGVLQGDQATVMNMATSAFFKQQKSADQMKITRVTYYVQPELVEKFIAFQETLKERKTKSERAAVWAFHTTDAKNVESIMEKNFDLQRVGKATRHRGKFGSGIYFSEYPDYSLRYGGYQKALLLCQVLPGKEYHCKKISSGGSVEEGYDSHVYAADKQGYGKELCFFDVDQILPLFHVEFDKVWPHNNQPKQNYHQQLPPPPAHASPAMYGPGNSYSGRKTAAGHHNIASMDAPPSFASGENAMHTGMAGLNTSSGYAAGHNPVAPFVTDTSVVSSFSQYPGAHLNAANAATGATAAGSSFPTLSGAAEETNPAVESQQTSRQSFPGDCQVSKDGWWDDGLESGTLPSTVRDANQQQLARPASIADGRHGASPGVTAASASAATGRGGHVSTGPGKSGYGRGPNCGGYGQGINHDGDRYGRGGGSFGSRGGFAGTDSRAGQAGWQSSRVGGGGSGGDWRSGGRGSQSAYSSTSQGYTDRWGGGGGGGHSTHSASQADGTSGNRSVGAGVGGYRGGANWTRWQNKKY
ncbi:uncharacterized protein LOC135817127 [Sycon ciliatum]|uniref:uncharacterized protein LOC135817127 n=1 Tax=Sycon ciliatum TaxID=27933 RepID=UPI0031F60AB4